MSITDTLNLLIEQTKEIVKKVSDLTLEEALQDSFLIYCFDVAVHTNTAHINKNVVT